MGERRRDFNGDHEEGGAVVKTIPAGPTTEGGEPGVPPRGNGNGGAAAGPLALVALMHGMGLLRDLRSHDKGTGRVSIRVHPER